MSDFTVYSDAYDMMVASPVFVYIVMQSGQGFPHGYGPAILLVIATGFSYLLRRM